MICAQQWSTRHLRRHWQDVNKIELQKTNNNVPVHTIRVNTLVVIVHLIFAHIYIWHWQDVENQQQCACSYYGLFPSLACPEVFIWSWERLSGLGYYLWGGSVTWCDSGMNTTVLGIACASCASCGAREKFEARSAVEMTPCCPPPILRPAYYIIHGLSRCTGQRAK